MSPGVGEGWFTGFRSLEGGCGRQETAQGPRRESAGVAGRAWVSPLPASAVTPPRPGLSASSQAVPVTAADASSSASSALTPGPARLLSAGHQSEKSHLSQLLVGRPSPACRVPTRLPQDALHRRVCLDGAARLRHWEERGGASATALELGQRPAPAAAALSDPRQP